VITDAPATTVATLLEAAAARAAESLPASEVLSPGEFSRSADSLELTSSVLVAFTGPISGEIALVLDDELVAALQAAQLELAAAVGPALEAVAQAMGVAVGPAQPVDARMSLNRVLAMADAGVITLVGANGVRAAIAVGSDSGPAAAAAAPAAERLDLLRGVEMEATAELGRARITVNELLGLRNGAVIELDRAAGAAADLYVNGRLIAHGEVVVVDENYGLRITQVVSDDSGR